MPAYLQLNTIKETEYHQVIPADVQWKRINSLLKFLTHKTITYNAILLFYSSNLGAGTTQHNDT